MSDVDTAALFERLSVCAEGVARARRAVDVAVGAQRLAEADVESGLVRVREVLAELGLGGVQEGAGEPTECVTGPSAGEGDGETQGYTQGFMVGDIVRRPESPNSLLLWKIVSIIGSYANVLILGGTLMETVSLENIFHANLAQCVRCGTFHNSFMVRAVPILDGNGSIGYAATHHDAPTRKTRAEAEQDACHQRHTKQKKAAK